MFVPAFLTISQLLVLGIATAQPAVMTPATTAAAIVAASPAVVPTMSTTAAVRDYSAATIPQPSQAEPSEPNATSIPELTAEEAELFVQTNQERDAQGLDELQLDPLLCLMARGHSEDMAKRNYFDHMAPGPGPVSPMDRYLVALGFRPQYAFLGENIYFRSATESTDVSATEANNAFMHSDGHRANILQPKFTKMGIGFYRDPATGAFWVTEEFLRDVSQ